MDLVGEPLVSAGSSDEVALRRWGSCAGSIAGTGTGGRISVSAGERSQSHQPLSSKNVPSGSQQTDVVLPVQVPKVNAMMGVMHPSTM